MALMLVPRNLRLFRNNWVLNKTPIIQHHLRTSRAPVRNHLRYRIEIAPFAGAAIVCLLRQILRERQTSRSHRLFHKTFVASLYGLRTVGL